MSFAAVKTPQLFSLSHAKMSEFTQFFIKRITRTKSYPWVSRFLFGTRKRQDGLEVCPLAANV